MLVRGGFRGIPPCKIKFFSFSLFFFDSITFIYYYIFFIKKELNIRLYVYRLSSSRIFNEARGRRKGPQCDIMQKG